MEIIYKRDLQSIGQFKKKKKKEMCGETRTFHLCFGEGLSYNIRSAEDGLVQVSIQKLQVIFARAESSNCPRLNWQSCGFLPFPYSQQGYMNFNS